MHWSLACQVSELPDPNPRMAWYLACLAACESLVVLFCSVTPPLPSPPLPWYSCSGQALAPLTPSSAAWSLVSLDWVALRRCCSWLVLRSRMHRWDMQVSRHPWQWPRPGSCALTVLSAARLRSMLIPMPKPRVPSTQQPSESFLCPCPRPHLASHNLNLCRSSLVVAWNPWLGPWLRALLAVGFCDWSCARS